MSEKFKKDICRIVGHTTNPDDLNITSVVTGRFDSSKPNKSNPPKSDRIMIDTFPIGVPCLRCGYIMTAKVKYTDLKLKRYNILDRAKKKSDDK